jgi:hypothetical protein
MGKDTTKAAKGKPPPKPEPYILRNAFEEHMRTPCVEMRLFYDQAMPGTQSGMYGYRRKGDGL